MGVVLPLVEAAGVDFDEPLAAFSASRFCLLADGAMLSGSSYLSLQVNE